MTKYSFTNLVIISSRQFVLMFPEKNTKIMTKMVTYLVLNKCLIFILLFFFTFMGLLCGDRTREEDTHTKAKKGGSNRKWERE